MEIARRLLVMVICMSIMPTVLSLSFEQYEPSDILFTKSKVGIEILNTNDIELHKVDLSNTGPQCFSKCHKISECKSAVFFNQTKRCHLKSISRLNVTSLIKLSPDAQYFEKRGCETKFESKIKFIALVNSATDCKDISEQGWTADGIYGIEIPGEQSTYRPIHCRMSLLGGGWTVIQRRVDGVTSFQQNWKTYKEGFGDLSEDFWYGNEAIHQLTKPGTDNKILFELKAANGTTYFPYYDRFNIENEMDKYRLRLGKYELKHGPKLPSYSLADGIDIKKHNNKKFSTYDEDNDTDAGSSCSKKLHNAGWWFYECSKACLNCKFGEDGDLCLEWEQITGRNENCKSLKETVMMVRKR